MHASLSGISILSSTKAARVKLLLVSFARALVHRASRDTLLLMGFLLAGSTHTQSLQRNVPNSIEPLNGVETEFGEISVSPDARLRTITTRPAGTKEKLPAIYFIQWLSCDTVELTDTEDGWAQFLRTLIQESAMVMMRTEKAGVGDSEGGPCSTLDYDTELAHHKRAFLALREHPWVDRDRVFVVGASMGANMAPLVASAAPVRGIAVWGGGAHSWFERQLGFERRALELGDASASDIDRRMRQLSAFYSAYLLEGVAPADVEKRRPELKGIWAAVTGTDGETQFGRPYQFHQQAQRQEWANAWARTSAPVLVLFGEYDWYESQASVELIGRIVNRNAAGRGSVHIIPGLDHHFMRFESRASAFAATGGVPHARSATDLLLPWLHDHAK